VAVAQLLVVRPKPYARLGVQNHIMKRHIALGLVASTLFLAGCCTTPHATKWEYKNVSLQAYQLRPPNLSSALDDLGKDGWVVVGFTQEGTGDYSTFHYLLKRAK